MGVGGARCCCKEKRVPTKGLQNNKWPTMICERWHQLWDSLSLVDEATESHPMCMRLESRKADCSPGGWLSWHAGAPFLSRQWGLRFWSQGHRRSRLAGGNWRGKGMNWEDSSTVEKPGEPHRILLSGFTHSACTPEGSQIWSNRNSMWPGAEAHLRQCNGVQVP